MRYTSTTHYLVPDWAYHLGQMELGLPLELDGVIIGTIAGCVLITELLISRIALLRVCFGMKAKPRPK